MHTVVFSQDNTKPVIVKSNESISCEFTSFEFDSFAQNTRSDKTIIIISYKGAKETRNEIELRRLHNAKLYFTEYYKRTPWFRSSEKIITGVATEKTNEGKLDFYVDGKVELSIVFKNNWDLNLSPCYVEAGDNCKDEIKKLFYPCAEKFNKSKKSLSNRLCKRRLCGSR